MREFRFRRLTLVLSGSVIAVFGAAATASAAAGRHVLPGTKPTWTAAVAKTADVPAGAAVSAKVWLAPRDAASLDALATAVSDTASPQFGQFMSEPQYRARFAPTADAVAQVTQWLSGAGLTVTAVGADNHYVGVSGSAAAMNAAFGTQLAHYVVNGTTEQAPASDLSLPDSVSGLVQAVSGLTTLGHRIAPTDFGPPDAFVPGTPCSDFYGQKIANTLPKFRGKTLAWNVCGYTPTQLRGAYGVDASGQTGVGATVAITDAYDAPTLEADANTYSGRHGDQPFAQFQFSDRSVPENATTGTDCGGNGWYGEQALDVEAVHGMASGANVLYYGAASCNDDDLLAQLNQVVADNEASIVTNSWGSPTFVVIDGQTFSTIDQNLVNAYESVFKQGAVQGIGFYFSSGDNGDDLDAFGVKHPEYPTGDPWVTSVGGTSIAIDEQNQRLFETGWGTTLYNLKPNGKAWEKQGAFHGGAGGGYSQVFNRPWYQKDVVPSNGKGRAVPDIGMDSDPTTGMLVGETQLFALPSRFGPAGAIYGEYRIGGTSLGSPLLAGIQAVAEGAQRVGFANPRIYRLAQKQAEGKFMQGKRDFGPFYDATPQGDAANARADYVNGINPDDGVTYTVRAFDQDTSLFTTRGWDDVTGVGAPTATYIAELVKGAQ
ncbi:MAG TPA: S53 family peptidase [Gaiellales bacterium]|jgi:subtilase family serine protease|nr:S53 family peptidase [Gaiellales bacterium]